MVSSKKTGEEEKEKKKSKEANPIKPENKNKRKPSPKKPNNKTGNGVAKEPEVVTTTPSSSADSQHVPESQAESEQEQEKRTEEATSQRNKSKTPKKSSGNREEVDDADDDKLCRFPARRIWRIVKSQSSGSSITGDAAFLVNKATEKFLEQFCEDAYGRCVKDRKKSLSYQHLASAVSKQRRYDFLSDFVPEKIKAEAALAESKLTEKESG